MKKRKGIYHPTRDRLKSLEYRCSTLKCIDPVGEKGWACRNCRLSDEYERMSGIRIEELGEQNIVEL